MENKNVPARSTKPANIIASVMEHPSTMEKFKSVLKDNAEAFVASVIDLYNGDTYMQKCEPKQVAMEALKAATLKLPVNKSLGFSYLVPYNNKGSFVATMQIGYKGYIQLAMRTGVYRIINADVVYEGELKEVNKLTGEIDFRGEKKSDKIVGYFAHIEMTNGFSKTLYMTKEAVTKHAVKYSKSYGASTSAWKTDFDAMAKKTVIRNLLSHYGYLSVEMVGAMDNDIRADSQDRDEAVKDQANTKEVPQDVEYEEVTPEQPKEEPKEDPKGETPEPPKEKSKQASMEEDWMK